MHYLYGIKRHGPPRLIATFTSEQQLLAYVRWATLESHEPQHGKFEQGSLVLIMMSAHAPLSRLYDRVVPPLRRTTDGNSISSHLPLRHARVSKCVGVGTDFPRAVPL